uniref:Virion binding protein n=1 Tax=Rhizophora mucronata TaxID=61149 RepID=A0A2P2KE09_RHIMU
MCSWWRFCHLLWYSSSCGSCLQSASLISITPSDEAICLAQNDHLERFGAKDEK